MTHSVRSHLRLDIVEYDRAIRRFIPGYEEMLAGVVDAVAAVEPTRVVDLGAGTGTLAEQLLERPGIGRVALLDVDGEMLARARNRLARFGDRVSFVERSFEGPLDACEAFATSLALHHLPTLDAQTDVYRRVFEALPAGGVLVNGDVFMPESQSARDRLFSFWADHMVAAGIDRERAYGHFAEWAGEDHYQPLEEELAALRSVGFEAECAWEQGPIAVLVARR